MVVTPYQKQLTELFDQMEELLKRNPELLDLVMRSPTAGGLYTKTPIFKYEFVGGGTIEGYVSGLGMKSDGSSGGVIRGSGATLIYMDEMDMIPDVVIDKALKPILAEAEDVSLIGTSTPIGKAGIFKSWCKERPDFKEDYYPITVLPSWEGVKEEILRDSTAETFLTEYMAEFVEGGIGIFKSSLVQMARADYSYEEARIGELSFWRKMGAPDFKNLIYSIGIDWNKVHGTEFYVMAYHPKSGMYFGVDAVNIPMSEYSGEAFKEEVIRLNYVYNPEWIYADEGYGSFLIESLHYQASLLQQKSKRTDMEDSIVKLLTRLKAFNFSRNIEMREPVTHKIILKPGKGLLVENTVYIMERAKLMYPESDERLRKQFLNYVVDHIQAISGTPVYGMSNPDIGDHRLDALMLALVAFKLEYSEFGYPMSASEISYKASNVQQVGQPHSAEEMLREMRKGGGHLDINILKILRDKKILEPDEVASMREEQWLKQQRRRSDISRPTSDSGSILRKTIEKVTQGGPGATKRPGAEIRRRSF
jgi:hypothetical protein